MRFAFLLPLAAAALVFAPARDARANGRFPSANQLVRSPTDPKLFLLRTTFGVLISHDAGTTWDWICEKAVGYGGAQDPSVGVTGSGAIVVAAGEGLMMSSDTGCDWAFVPGYKDPVFSDLVVRGASPSSAIALESSYRAPDDAGVALYDNVLVATTDDGAHWAPLGIPLDPYVVLETVEVSRSDAQVLYLSGFRGADATFQALLLVSPDNGASWTPKTVPLDPATERAPFISAVDPKNPKRVYVRTGGGKTSRLLVTDDGGDSFRSVLDGPPMLGFALSEDGSKVYAGGINGLFEASSTDLKFTQKSGIQVQCLAAVGSTLYACSNEASGFVLGASTDDGATFKPVLHLDGVRGPLACSSDSSAAACVPDWPTLQQTLGIQPDGGPSGDGGIIDAGPETPVPAVDPSGGCGCNAAGSGLPTGLASLGVLLAATLVWRRRQRD